MTLLSLGVLAVLMPLVLFDAIWRPSIRRIGMRNVTRRAREAGLVIAGSLLATALITASFVIGDSFDSSIRDIARTRFGPTDEIVETETAAEATALAQAIVASDSADIDGVLMVTSVRLAAGSVGEGRLVEPSIRLLEFDLEAGSGFGGDSAATGLSAQSSSLGIGEVSINNKLSKDLGIESGDPIELFADGNTYPFVVAEVLEIEGLAGMAEVIARPGALTSQLGGADSIVSHLVLVSNTGGVFDGAERTDTVVSQIEALTGSELEVRTIKADLLEDADEEGAETTQLFGTIGGFSVIAGILLVINLFVMLASERKAELGTMRALGMSRGSIVRSFSLEGAIYGAIAACLGALGGIGVGLGVVGYASSRLVEDGGVRLSPSIQLGSLASGAIIGFAISQITVLLTSIKMTKLNIVRALKDLPEPRGNPHRTRNLVFGGLGLVGSAGLWAVAGTSQIGALLIPALAAIAAIPLLARVIPSKVAAVIGCGAGLVWTASAFGILSETLKDPDIGVFLLQGVLLVGFGSAIVAVLDAVWLRIADSISSGVATKLGMAHPLDRPVRSVMLVAMFALVLFTVTFMGIMNAVFQAQGPEMAHRVGGEYDMILDANPASGFDVTELESSSDIAVAAPVRRLGMDIVFEPYSDGQFQDEDTWGVGVSFVDPNFAGIAPPAPALLADEFEDSEEAWDAVLSGQPHDERIWVMAPDWSELEVGQSVQFIGDEGSTIDAHVAGKVELGWMVGSGFYLPASLETALDGDVLFPTTRFYMQAAEGNDPEQIAAALTGSNPERGADARAFTEAAQVELDGQKTFLTMLQGYLGLGLLIGIAGLSVVLIRAVRERRRQIGMMRAIGISATRVRSMFVVEALFIGAQGVILGLGLGTLSSWQILTKSSAFERGLDFTVPGWWLVGLGSISLVFSVLAAVGPALRAGNESPAEALRFTG